MQSLWYYNPKLVDTARWPRARHLAVPGVAVDVLILGVLGITAAVLTCYRFPDSVVEALGLAEVRIPGHAILRGTLPLVLGISLAPRRTSGTIMSLFAGATFGAIRMYELGGLWLPGVPAWLGILCLGPALDLALARVRPGWKLYAACGMAGLAANMLALAVRVYGNSFGLQMRGGGRAFENLPFTFASFALCGLIAGLVSGILWFRLTPKSNQADSQ